MAEGFPLFEEIPQRKTVDINLDVQAFNLPADVNRLKHPFRMLICGIQIL
jgi:hypothetical protein